MVTSWSATAFLSCALEQEVDVEHPARIPLAGRSARLMDLPHRIRLWGHVALEGHSQDGEREMPPFALPNERGHIYIIVEGLQVP